ncbi:DVU_1553 family AMP-dependent CoA ligase [Desulfosporosinus sp.]|uniref:DVU_1553 family AMP-dependent CoA ligase n=1 Tax=Desulfosporosinus sp. TaxID=157907 RepID=UPI002314B8C6|nr:AMP-binding protein [Desulfosporosinus sp.]MDA8220627.1 AMP-binding protein [Desulfitobacterium hafniense]
MDKTPLDDWIGRKIGLQPGDLSREAIEDYQLNRLRETMALAKEKSAYYRKSLALVDPRQITFAEFAELPFTFPQDIQHNPLKFICTSQNEIDRIVSLQSSGTTGEPKRIYFTKEDQELTIDYFDYGMRNLVGPMDRVLILLPWEVPGSVGDLLRMGLERMNAYPIPYGPVYDAGEAIEAALEYQINSMVGIPNHVLSMARHERSDLLKGRIKSVLLTTDHVPNSVAQTIEEKWNCQVFNHYGMTEMGLGGGVQCSARLSYHLREADLYFEIINPETGGLLPEGELGEIVFTTLTRRGMPLIRYRTGDSSRFTPGNCPCGSVLRNMEVVKGRISGKQELAGIELSMAELDEVLFPVDGVLDFQCNIEEADGMDYIYLNLMKAESQTLDEQGIHRALQTIPAIRNGMDQDQLKVVVNVSENRFPVSKGTLKRKILDNRLNC